MSSSIQIRRDTAANWTSVNPVLAEGEIGFEKDTLKVKFGDGVTAWNSLSYYTSPVEWDDVLNKPSTFTPATHAYSSHTGLPDLSSLHSHSNKSLLDTYTQTEANLASAVSLKHSNSNDHSHANKSLLDTYSQTEVNLADAVTKKHSHANQTALDNVSGTNTGDQDLSGKQNLDSDLTSIAGLTPTNDDVIQRKAGAWTNRTMAQVKTDLVLVKGDVGLSNVDNTTDAGKPVSTATQTALDLKAPNASYRTILDCSGSHTAAKVAGTYAIPQSQPLAVSGTGTLYPLNTIFIASADFPSVGSVAPKLRIRVQLYTNDTAPTGNFTFGLYPITRPATSGGAGLCIFTLGTVVSGSNGASFTAPAADGLLNAVSSDFALPTDGHYVIGVVTTATVATNAHIHISASLQMRNN